MFILILSVPYFINIVLVRRSMIKFASTLLMTLRKEVLINTAMSFQHILHFFRFKIHLRASEMAHSVKSFIHMPEWSQNPLWEERALCWKLSSVTHTNALVCASVCTHTIKCYGWRDGSVVKRLAALLLKMQVWLLTPTWWLAAIYNSGSGDLTLLWALRAPGIHMVHRIHLGRTPYT